MHILHRKHHLRILLIFKIFATHGIRVVSTPAIFAGLRVSYVEMARFLTRRTDKVDEARHVFDAWLHLAKRERRGEAPPQPGSDITHQRIPKAYLFTVARHQAMGQLSRGNWLQSYMRESEAQARLRQRDELPLRQPAARRSAPPTYRW